jgi:hypothetical protein
VSSQAAVEQPGCCEQPSLQYVAAWNRFGLPFDIIAPVCALISALLQEQMASL